MPSIAELEAAIATGSLDRWLDELPEPARPIVRRAIEIDRPLWTQHRDSLASCLLARTLGAGLAALHARWTQELDARGTPWIAALRPCPVVPGLLAEANGSNDHPIDGYGAPVFESEDVVCVQPSARAATHGRRAVRWSWRRGELAHADVAPRALASYPKIEGGGWKPVFVTTAPGAAPVSLPRPPESSAEARVMADGARLLVYGALEDYNGGFVHILDLATLAIQRSLKTRKQVLGVSECDRDDLLMISTSAGPVAWCGERAHELPISTRHACLSPSGAHVATVDRSLRIWSMTELIQSDLGHLSHGFPACFDPSGERLLCGTRLFDGRTGRPIAELTHELSAYLEGAPAMPWMHLGTQYLISLHAGLAAWDSHTGQPIPTRDDPASDDLHYAYWYSLAYDRAGTRLAALRQDSDTVVLHELPHGEILDELTFRLTGRAVAISPDGTRIAVHDGDSVEVLTVDGDPVLLYQGQLAKRDDEDTRYGEPEPVQLHGPSHVAQLEEATLRFSNDGRRIARFSGEDGWRIWSLDRPETERVAAEQPLDVLADFAPAWPTDWTVQSDSKTVFTHIPTGTRIALPAAGPWLSNPACPRILACENMHVELRSV